MSWTPEQRKEVVDKIHRLTYLVCENDMDVESEEYLIHPDFITGMEALAFSQENGFIDDAKMTELNDLFKKHKKMYIEKFGQEPDFDQIDL